MSDIQLSGGWTFLDKPSSIKHFELPGGWNLVDYPSEDILAKAEIARTLQGFSDPEEEAARINNAAFVHRNFNVSPEEAYDHVDEYITQLIGEKKPPHKKFAQDVHDTWTYGTQQVALGKMRWREMLTAPNEELSTDIETLKSQMKSPEHAERSLPVRALLAATEMAPIMWAGIQRGAKTGLLAGAGGAAVAAIAGQIGPQVVLPEEAVTVPGAFLTLFSVGMMTGSTQEIMEIEGGLAYDEMLGAGVDPQIAKPIGITVGVINGLIETAQISELMNTIPGGQALLRKAITHATKKVIAEGGLKKIALKFAAQYGKHIVFETTQEIVQETVTVLGTEIGKEFTIRRPGGRGVAPVRATTEEILNRLKDTAVQSALAFSVMAFPGTTSTAIADALKARPKVETEVKVKPEVVEQEAVDIDLKYTKAIKTNDGKIHTDPNAKYHVEIAELQRIDPMDVAESGRVIQGRYLREDKFIDWVAKGEKEKDLPPMTKEYFVQRITETVPQVTLEQAEAVATLVEARAESEGLSLEEYTQKYFAPEIVTGEKPVSEALFQRELPEPPPIPSEGHYPAFKTDDGSLYVITEPQTTHVTFIKKMRIPPERIVSGGWIVDGVYEPSFQSDTMRFVEQYKAKIRVARRIGIEEYPFFQGEPLSEIDRMVKQSVEAGKEARKLWKEHQLVGEWTEEGEAAYHEATRKAQEAQEYLAKAWNVKGDRGYGGKFATEKAAIIALRRYNKLNLALMQGEKGAVSFVEEGKALIHATKATDFSTFVHEIGHVWRRQLSDDDLRTIEEWADVKEGKWSREAEEKFANGLEQYLREETVAETFSDKLRTVFEKFKEWLKNIYDRFAKMQMPENVRRVYEGLLLPPEEQDRRLANKPFTEKDTPREALQEILRNIDQKKMTYVAGLFNKAQQGSIQRTIRYGLNDRAYKYWMKLMNVNPAKYRKIFAMLEEDYDSAAFWAEQGYTVVHPGEAESTDEAATAVKAKEQPAGPTLAALEEELEEEAEKIGATNVPTVNAKKRRTSGKPVLELNDAYTKLRERWFQARDEGLIRNTVQRRHFQRLVKESLGLKKYNTRAQELDAAIEFYIDSKRNPKHVERYFEIVNADDQKAMKKILTWITEDKEKELLPTVEEKQLHKILENLREIRPIVERSQNLTPAELAIAEQIEQQGQKLGKEALDAEVIHNTLEHYAGRVWDRRGKEVAPILRRFGTTTHHAKHRVFDTILEGYAKGHQLKIKGATNNLHIVTEELIKTMADKAFLKAMLGFKDVDGNPLLTTHANLEGYAEINHPNFVTWKWIGKAEEGKVYGKNVFITEEGDLFEKQALFVPKEQAKNLNNMLEAVKLKDWQKFLLHWNAVFKRIILTTSFFHHLAFMRSYYLGTNHKIWREMNFIKAYKEGLRAIDELQPEILLGVRNGLTLGVQQEWAESLVNEDPVLDPILEKIKPAKQVVERIRALRAWWTDKLFGVFGAGLKAKAFLIEYRNELKRRPGADPNEIARDVANMINDDFGGLHLQRMGRSQALQATLRFLLLAPDWTESNVRTMIKMVGVSTDKGYGPVTKKQRQMYQRFWANALIKGLGATVLLNFVMAGGDPERFFENYKRMWRETIRKGGIGGLRILDVDVTPLYKLMGGKSDRRKYFSLIGHFRDPIKFMAVPLKSMRHKSSVLVNMFIELMTKADWASRRFTTFGELIRTGKTVDWHPDPSSIDFEWVPSYVISQLVGVMPIQIQNLIAAISGEQEWFESIANSFGLGVRTTY